MGSNDAPHRSTRRPTIEFSPQDRQSHRLGAACPGDDECEPPPMILRIHRIPCAANEESEEESLAAHLATLVDLRLQLQQTAWNLCGPVAGEVGCLCRSLSEELNDLMSLLANQARGMGLPLRTSISDLMELTLLRPFPDGPVAVPEAVDRLTEAYLTLHEDAWTGACRCAHAVGSASSAIFVESLAAYERHLSRLRSAAEQSPSHSPSVD